MLHPPIDIASSWKPILEPELEKPYFSSLWAFIASERHKGCAVYPPDHLIFNAFQQTPYDDVKVLIVGQDPYHGPGQAHGLAFSVPEGLALPPSLKNIYKELEHDLGVPISQSGSLLHWAKQGVLLLNTTLTVRKGEPLSHAGKGWELFTDHIVRALGQKSEPMVFVLWGNAAKKKCEHLIGNDPHHLILTSAHPSPFSARSGFFGCGHFSKINAFLQEHGCRHIQF